MTEVLHVVDRFSPASIPIEVAVKLGEHLDISIVAYFDEDTTSDGYFSDLPVDVYELEAKRRLDPDAISGLRSLLVENSFDILHTHHNSSSAISRLITHWMDDSPVVLHNEHSEHRNYSLKAQVGNALCAPLTDCHIFVSEQAKNSLKSWERPLYGANTIIHNGIDIPRIEEAREESSEFSDLTCTDDGIVIGSVGMLRPVKSHRTIIRAFEYVLREYPDSQLVLVGDGPTRPDIEQLARELGIEDRVLITGLLPREEVYSLLHELDLFIMSSVSEGFCVAVAEAMASELPVVVSDIPTLRNLVGETGYFAEPECPESFADALVEAIQNPDKSREYARQAKLRIENNYTLERTVDKYIKTYNRVLDN